MENVVIIGTGPAGYTAAIYAARADLAPLILTGAQPGGQLTTTTDVENFPGFPEGIMGPQLIDNMRKQAQRFGAKCEMKAVSSVNFSDPKNLTLKVNGEEIGADSVIIATGSNARWLKLGKGEEKYWGKGYTACATCDGAFFRGKTVAIVGGGDSACEEATFLTKFADKVYMIHRRKELRASKPMQKRVFDNDKIEIVWNQNVTDLKGEPTLQSVELTETDTGETSELAVDGLFMAIGHDPATKFLDDALELENGYIKVTNHTHTSIPSVFVGGDVADWHYQQAISAAGWGCMAALDAEHYLTTLES